MDYLQVTQTSTGVKLLGVRNFSLPGILNCGQAFRWRQENADTWQGIAYGRFLRITHRADSLLLHGATLAEFEAIWKGYFDLDRDYGKLKELLCRDAVLAKAVAFTPGIRVLRQEPWEALCCFIISQNNNIGRITGIVERLCTQFGTAIEGGHTFPTPAQLAGCSVEDLAPLRAGFRAKYLLDAARRVARGELVLESLFALPLQEAKEALMTIHGVGPKVADCALLYGFSRVECVPMDVWMKRVMAQLFPAGFSAEVLPVAGLAQQYLFHYARLCPQALPDHADAT